MDRQIGGKVDGKEEFPWHIGVFDAHCHPTDTIASQDNVPNMKARALTIMATRAEDQSIVRQFANNLGTQLEMLKNPRSQGSGGSSCQVVPSFGWHPWFSHHIFDDMNSKNEHANKPDVLQHYKAVLLPPPDNEFISSLPEPRPLSSLLLQLRGCLESFPYALVGEIGIDRSFRLPTHWEHDDRAKRDEGLTPGGREGRQLTPYRVDIDHQRRILKAQLNLAGELERPVSVHGVAAHGTVLETLKETWHGHEKKVLSNRERKRRSSAAAAHDAEDTLDRVTPNEGHHAPSPKPYPPRICLHSYSGPANVMEQYLYPVIPATIFFSFSCFVNFSSRTEKAVEVIKAVPNDKILIESDLHSAGDKMDQVLENVVRSVCKIKGWSLSEGVTKLAENWRHFVFGDAEPNPLNPTNDR
ncbi:MAG: hypothetical protein Q9201_003778 [Fulgogasparrea decipioides]